MKAKPEMRALCVKLRVDERLSISEIQRRTGAARGSLSLWLRGHPLTPEERRIKASAAPRGKAPKKDRGVRSRLHEMADGRELSRHEKAKIAEAAVLLRLTVRGMAPYGPVFDGDKADWLVVNASGRALKIQVKWARVGKYGLPMISLECRQGATRRRYVAGEFDFIAGYDLYSDTCFVWSFDELRQNRRTVTASPTAAERWDKLEKFLATGCGLKVGRSVRDRDIQVGSIPSTPTMLLRGGSRLRVSRDLLQDGYA